MPKQPKRQRKAGRPPKRARDPAKPPHQAELHSRATKIGQQHIACRHSTFEPIKTPTNEQKHLLYPSKSIHQSAKTDANVQSRATGAGHKQELQRVVSMSRKPTNEQKHLLYPTSKGAIHKQLSKTDVTCPEQGHRGWSQSSTSKGVSIPNPSTSS